MKPWLCALALLALSAPLRAQTGDVAPPADQPQQEVPKAVKLDDGLIVTPVIVPYDDLSSMLDVQMWRFNIKPPATDTNFQAQLEVRKRGAESGDEIQHRNAVGFTLFEETELTFALMPKGGHGFTGADFWRVHFASRRLSGRTSFGPIDADLQNPMKDFRWDRGEVSGENGAIAHPVPNGDIILQKYIGGTPEKPVTVELVLVITKK